MKKFIMKVLFFIAFCATINIVIPYVVDPYNVFHADNLRDNGVAPNQNYLKMNYVINSPDKFDSFIFGSSRVGAIHVEKIPTNSWYNMSYSNGLPSEHLKNIETFIINGIVPETLYVGIDSLYTLEEKYNRTDARTVPYEYLKENKDVFYNIYLNPMLTFQSLPVIINHNVSSDYDYFYEYGWWCDYDRKTNIDWSQDLKPSIGNIYNVKNKIQKSLEAIQAIKSLCDTNGIEVIFFTNPMHQVTYEASVKANYYEFLRGVAEITDFYNFSGINDITVNNDYYIDTSHYNAYVGDMIIDTIYHAKTVKELLNQGFGMYVTSENIDDLIMILEQSTLKYFLE